MNDEPEIQLTLSADEIRYLVRCGAALAQNVPRTALPSYCGFTLDEIIAFSDRMKNLMESAGIDF